MSAPLPAQADPAEWQQHLQDLSARAEKMLRSRSIDVNAHAELALAAFRVLWAGWSPELILSSVKASELVGTAVISGRPIAGQLLELEDWMASWAEASDQVQPEPVNVMLPELLVAPGTYPEPSPPKRAGRRPRQELEPEGEPDPVVEPVELPVLVLEPEPPEPELPDLWYEQDRGADPEPEPLVAEPPPARRLELPPVTHQPSPPTGWRPWSPPEPPANPLPVTVHQGDEQEDAEPVALWPDPVPAAEPEPAITAADLPETITAVQVAAWWGKSLPWVYSLTRRGVLQLGIHYRNHRHGLEPRGNRYRPHPTFQAIAAASNAPIPDSPLMTVVEALQPRLPRRAQRRELAEQVLAELAG